MSSVCSPYRRRGANLSDRRAWGGGGGQDPHSDYPEPAALCHPSFLRGREIGMWYAIHRRQLRGLRRRRILALRHARSPMEDGSSSTEPAIRPRGRGRRPREDGSSSTEPAIRPRGRGRRPMEHFKVRQERLERLARAVVCMDESREKHITELLNSVQSKPEEREEKEELQPWSWRATENKKNNFIPLETKKSETSILTQDLEYVLQKNEPSMDLNEQLKEDLLKKRKTSRYLEMQRFREKLPSFGMREEVINVINNNQVTVISGETGCGKTTQVTQFILDDYIERGIGSVCRVVCTQPRRISAISVAERVASERAEVCGNGGSTGYQIRLQSRMPRKQGSILYCTTGIVLQWLQSDPYLSSVSHVVLDEIHERNLQSDVLMTIVKDLLKLRPDIKVILMSATLNAEKFSAYFGICPMLHIPGFTFPVKEYLLEDVIEMVRYFPEKQGHRFHWKKGFMQGRVTRTEKERKEALYRAQFPDFLKSLELKYSSSTIAAMELMDDDRIDHNLIVALIRHIVLKGEDGAILVFLPGWADISTLNEQLMSQVMFKSDRFIIIPLHSLMPTVNQTQVFKKTPPGVRKIVIATNIAETSITIDDVVYVIDAGKIKETNYDTQNSISTMAPEWVSHANAKQRKGRAGRVQPGYCYHLYNSLRDSLLEDYQLPEILRTPLEELCLQIKILKLGRIAAFLAKLMDPPSPEAGELAIKHLLDLNALNKEEELTPLGFHLARLPVEPHIGKMILFAALFCCLDPVLTIAGSLSFKDPFVIPLGKEKVADVKRKELSNNTKSDHLTVVNAFEGWEEAKVHGMRSERDYCWAHFLSANTLQMLHSMKGQFAEHLLAARFVSSKNPKDPKSNINSDNEKLIKAVICAGLYPKVAKIRATFRKKQKPPKLYTKTDGKVSIHPKSVNVEECEYHYSWLVYHLKMRTSNIFLYDCTEVSPYSLLFFGGDISIQKDQEQDTISVDDWIVFQSPEKTANLVKDLRKELDVLLQEKIEKPQPVDWDQTSSRDCAVLSAIIDLITTQENVMPKNGVHQVQDCFYN